MKSATITNLKNELKEHVKHIRADKATHRLKQREFSHSVNTADVLNRVQESFQARFTHLFCKKEKVKIDFNLLTEAEKAYNNYKKEAYIYRHKHIAFCLLRGKTMEQIEPKTHNPPDEKYLNELLEAYKKELENEQKALCPSGC